MTRRWRLLDSGPGSGDWNMALDRALVERVSGGGAMPTLRFYAWDRPTLSFGRMQHVPSELLRRCQVLGVAAVRRPTGGRAVLHHHEVTFSIIAPTTGLGSVMQSYRTFARAVAAGLRNLGLEVTLCEMHGERRAAGSLCFADHAGCDLQARGRKLVGSAQARHTGVLLQQNSLPLRLSHPLKQELFGVAAVQEEARLATDLAGVLGHEPSYERVRDAVIAGFEAELGVGFREMTCGADVRGAADDMRPTFVL